MNILPTHLRIVETKYWPSGKPMSFVVQFDGDPDYNKYDLWIRPAQRQPTDDDPFGGSEFVPNPDGGK